MAPKFKKEVYFVLHCDGVLYDSETCFVMKDEIIFQVYEQSCGKQGSNSITASQLGLVAATPISPVSAQRCNYFVGVYKCFPVFMFAVC